MKDVFYRELQCNRSPAVAYFPTIKRQPGLLVRRLLFGEMAGTVPGRAYCRIHSVRGMSCGAAITSATARTLFLGTAGS